MAQEKQTTRTDKSSYEAEYPFNKVFETPGGHQFQFDDTPGKERFFWRHPSGNFMEVSHDGKQHSVTVGDSKSYAKGGVTLSIDENNDVKMSGHNRIMMQGGGHIEVAGDAGIAVGGATALVAMGPVNMRASSGYMGFDGDLNVNASGGINIKAAGNMTLKAARIDLN